MKFRVFLLALVFYLNGSKSAAFPISVNSARPVDSELGLTFPVKVPDIEVEPKLVQKEIKLEKVEIIEPGVSTINKNQTVGIQNSSVFLPNVTYSNQTEPGFRKFFQYKTVAEPQLPKKSTHTLALLACMFVSMAAAGASCMMGVVLYDNLKSAYEDFTFHADPRKASTILVKICLRLILFVCPILAGAVVGAIFYLAYELVNKWTTF